MGITKRNGLLLVAKIEAHISNAMDAWKDGDKATFMYHKGYASSLTETVNTLVGEKAALHQYLHGRMTWLLSQTTMLRYWEHDFLEEHEGFVIRPLSSGGWYAVGITPFGDAVTEEEAIAQIEHIRSLFALPKLPAREGC